MATSKGTDVSTSSSEETLGASNSNGAKKLGSSNTGTDTFGDSICSGDNTSIATASTSIVNTTITAVTATSAIASATTTIEATKLKPNQEPTSLTKPTIEIKTDTATTSIRIDTATAITTTGIITPTTDLALTSTVTSLTKSGLTEIPDGVGLLKPSYATVSTPTTAIASTSTITSLIKSGLTGIPDSVGLLKTSYATITTTTTALASTVTSLTNSGLTGIPDSVGLLKLSDATSDTFKPIALKTKLYDASATKKSFVVPISGGDESNNRNTEASYTSGGFLSSLISRTGEINNNGKLTMDATKFFTEPTTSGASVRITTSDECEPVSGSIFNEPLTPSSSAVDVHIRTLTVPESSSESSSTPSTDSFLASKPSVPKKPPLFKMPSVTSPLTIQGLSAASTPSVSGPLSASDASSVPEAALVSNTSPLSVKRISCDITTKIGLLQNTKDRLFRLYAIPENSLLKGPRLNAGFESVLSDDVRERDRDMQERQKQLGHGITAIHEAISSLLSQQKSYESIESLYSACNILADLHYCVTRDRIRLIASSIDDPVSLLLARSERDETLFGRNLHERMDITKVKKKNNVSEDGPSQEADFLRLETPVSSQEASISSLEATVMSLCNSFSELKSAVLNEEIASNQENDSPIEKSSISSLEPAVNTIKSAVERLKMNTPETLQPIPGTSSLYPKFVTKSRNATVSVQEATVTALTKEANAPRQHTAFPSQYSALRQKAIAFDQITTSPSQNASVSGHIESSEQKATSGLNINNHVQEASTEANTSFLSQEASSALIKKFKEVLDQETASSSHKANSSQIKKRIRRALMRVRKPEQFK